MHQNRKGFVEILGAVILGSLILGASILYANFKSNEVKDFGSNILQTQLTDTIGTFRTNVNTSLSNLSSDLASVTSTIATYGTMAQVNSPAPIGNGGTGTTTFNNGLVVASGTSAMTSLQTNGNGSIPIASGTSWVARQLTAGSNITITTSTPGQISITSSAGSVSLASHNTSGVRINDSATYVVLATSTDFGAAGNNDFYQLRGYAVAAGGTVNWNININGVNIVSSTIASNHTLSVFLDIGMTSSTSAQNFSGFTYDTNGATISTFGGSGASVNMSTSTVFTFSTKAAFTDVNTKFHSFDIIKYGSGIAF